MKKTKKKRKLKKIRFLFLLFFIVGISFAFIKLFDVFLSVSNLSMLKYIHLLLCFSPNILLKGSSLFNISVISLFKPFCILS